MPRSSTYLIAIDTPNNLISYIDFKSGFGHLFLTSPGGGVGQALENKREIS